MFLQCVDSNQHKILLLAFHNEACKGHYSSTITTFKILRNGYYYLGTFKDVYKWVGKSDKYKMFTSKPQLTTLSLRPIVIEDPFKLWSVDFIGPLNPLSSA